MLEGTEYVGVQFMDMPHSIGGITVMVDADTFIIFLNGRLSHDRQIQAYDHEIDHINNRDFDMMYTVDELEGLRHAVAG